jgi:hypothetical protein
LELKLSNDTSSSRPYFTHQHVVSNLLFSIQPYVRPATAIFRRASLVGLAGCLQAPKERLGLHAKASTKVNDFCPRRNLVSVVKVDPIVVRRHLMTSVVLFQRAPEFFLVD